MKRIEELKAELKQLLEDISLRDLLESDTLVDFIEDVEMLLEIGSLSKLTNRRRKLWNTYYF